MANSINSFVNGVQLDTMNSLTHLLNTAESEELNAIQHSPYFGDDELINSNVHDKYTFSIVSLNCQSFYAKFDYIKVLVDKFMNNNTPIQVLCLQESWFSTDTDLSLYNIPGYHMISTGHYASNHGGLVIYLHNKWDYVLKTCNTVSKLWERQIIEVYDPTNTFKRNIIIGNIYRPPYNTRYYTDTFLEEFKSTLSEFHFNRQNTYFCGDYNIDLLKVERFQFNEEYFDSILTAGYIPTITLPTRLSENSTLIDNVLTNNFSNNWTKAFILNIHISDHQPIMLLTNDQTPAAKTQVITIRTNSDEAKHRFRTSFHDKYVIDKLDLINPDPNTNYEILEKELKESHQECFPVRTVKFNGKKHKKNYG